jgi:aryl-alcohol dehydrogenase-like predicted oxidoreductase
MGSDDARIGRRELLRRGAAAGLSLSLAPLAAAAGEAAAPADAEPRVRRHVTLGRTGLRVSDVGFGSSRLRGDEDVVRHALARGITYFDTAEGYTGGQSEETLGRALAGRRDEVVLVSKVSASATATQAELMRALEGSLRRLRSDRIDVYFNHAVNDLARLENPEWHAFTARAKEQGKIRFVGISGHGGRLVSCLERALEQDSVEVILAAHNFGEDPRFWERATRGLDFVARQPGLPRVLARAREQKVGVVAMKTLMGARLNDLRPYETDGATFAQAALRWTLSQPDTDALVVTMTSREQVDEYLGASGFTRPRGADRGLLRAYLAANGASHCRQGCDACEDSCPHGVAVSDVLRSRMYAEDYGDARLACDGSPCAGACPFGLPVGALTRRTQRLLGRRPSENGASGRRESA